MGEHTSIAWTDRTFNPWWGCTKVSPGCDHCYAESWDARFAGNHWGKGMARREFGDKHWNEPLRWNRLAEKAGAPLKVFCGSMCDVMDDEAPKGARERLWGIIDATPHLTWQLLTKRPQRYARYLPHSFIHDNVWLGTSAENQHYYNLRWEALRLASDLYGLTTFISYEPALGPIVLGHTTLVPDWIIFGGESGAGRRPMELAWARDLRAECEKTGTAFFMKQVSAHTPDEGAALIPVDMLIRQYPVAPAEQTVVG